MDPIEEIIRSKLQAVASARRLLKAVYCEKFQRTRLNHPQGQRSGQCQRSSGQGHRSCSREDVYKHYVHDLNRQVDKLVELIAESEYRIIRAELCGHGNNDGRFQGSSRNLQCGNPRKRCRFECDALDGTDLCGMENDLCSATSKESRDKIRSERSRSSTTSKISSSRSLSEGRRSTVDRAESHMTKKPKTPSRKSSPVKQKSKETEEKPEDTRTISPPETPPPPESPPLKPKSPKPKSHTKPKSPPKPESPPNLETDAPEQDDDSESFITPPINYQRCPYSIDYELLSEGTPGGSKENFDRDRRRTTFRFDPAPRGDSNTSPRHKSGTVSEAASSRTFFSSRNDSSHTGGSSRVGLSRTVSSHEKETPV